MTNSLPKLLITGGNGQLAQAMLHHAQAKNFQLILLAKEQLDITNAEEINAAITHYQPDAFINTAAYTAVDKAEKEPDTALQINYMGTQQLAIACEDNNIPLIHLSTDYVFAGDQQTPYLEDDATNPINVYGHSKWFGEKAIRLYNTNHVILRTSGVFSEFGNNFLKAITRLAQEKSELSIVADQTTCPTYAGDIAGAIFALAHHPLKGTYHYCSAEPTSWYHFALAILEEAKQRLTLKVETINAINAAEYLAAAKRPAYSALDCSKIKRDLQIEQPSWRKAILSSFKGI